ncbi:hypothetical protein MBLNU457_1456t1 [Dothideomycetes sp. NU457]
MDSDHQTYSPRRQSRRLSARHVDTETSGRKSSLSTGTTARSKTQTNKDPRQHTGPALIPADTSVDQLADSSVSTPLAAPAPLTRQNLRQFTRSMAGPVTTTKSGTPSDNTAKTKESNTTTTDPDLAPKLTRNSVQHVNADPEKPKDFQEYKESWKRSRGSPEPDASSFKQYEKMLSARHTECMTQARFWPFLAKPPYERQETYLEYMSVQWSTLKNGITTGISPAKPDLVEAMPQEAYPREAEGTLRELYPGRYGFVMPSFAAEFKSTATGMVGAYLQCAYDGALMVHSALQAHLYMYGNLDDFYGKTKAITIAFNGDNVEYFLHHATADSEKHDEAECEHVFHQSRLGRDLILGDEDAFKQARKHIRNAQDMGYALAKDLQRQLQAHYDGVEAAARAARAPTQVPPSNAPLSPDRSSATNHPHKRVKLSATEP